MTTITISRPQADEHIPYYGRYISQVPEGDLIALLRQQAMDTVALLRGVPREREDYAYAPGKWTIKEVVGHMIDAERVFAYRALTFARAEGIIPAPEPSHALAAVIEEAQRCASTGEAKVILTALCGHGHFDMVAYERYLSGEMADFSLPQDRISAALADLPVIPEG